MDGGAWWAAVHGVAKSRTRLSDFTFTHWRRKWQPTPVFLPGESQEQRSLMGCFHLSLSCIGEGNGNPLQCSCLENPREGGAWWAAVHGVAQSRTRLSDFTFTHWRRKWQPIPVFLPGESQGWRSLVGCRLWGRTESDTTEATWQQQQL